MEGAEAWFEDDVLSVSLDAGSGIGAAGLGETTGLGERARMGDGTGLGVFNPVGDVNRTSFSGTRGGDGTETVRR